MTEELQRTKSPVEEAFKRVYGYYPEGCERSVWIAFKKGYEEAQVKEWGEKNKPPTLKELLWEWWDCNDIFTSNSDLDADTCIDGLVNIIGEKFIPPSNDRNGYEWEKCLKMMRGKLR